MTILRLTGLKIVVNEYQYDNNVYTLTATDLTLKDWTHDNKINRVLFYISKKVENVRLIQKTHQYYIY